MFGCEQIELFYVEYLISIDCSIIGHVADRCDFESSLCSWEIGTNAPEQPRRWKGRTPSYFTGPSKDHTNKSIGRLHM